MFGKYKYNLFFRIARSLWYIILSPLLLTIFVFKNKKSHSIKFLIVEYFEYIKDVITGRDKEYA